MTINERRFGRAVIVGSGIAGLVGARVLADHFEHVTIIERDPRPEGPEIRKGVPQMRHIHGLLEVAVKALRRLFPDVIERLDRIGVVNHDITAATAWNHCGGWKLRLKSDFETITCTRPRFEWEIRKAIEALPNVEVRYNSVAEGLLAANGPGRVTGVRWVSDDGSEVLDADLIVDAAGRGSRAPRWLEALGYQQPSEERIHIDIGYTTRLYERPADFNDDIRVLFVNPRNPAWRGGFIVEVEDRQLQITLNGYFKDHPPVDDEGFLAFAQSLPVPDVYQVIQAARPISEPAVFKFPYSRWLHYEDMPRLPDGFLPLGDSVCLLNPIYGQGMTMAIAGACALGDILAERSRVGRDLGGLPRAFQKKLAGLLRTAWTLSTTMDLAYAKTKGKRPLGVGALQWALMNLIDLTSTNERVCKAFYELMHMRRGPEALASPDVLLPLLAYSAKGLFVPPESRVNGSRRPPPP